MIMVRFPELTSLATPSPSLPSIGVIPEENLPDFGAVVRGGSEMSRCSSSLYFVR